MRRMNFSENLNGKLLNDCFTTIRLYDYDKYPDLEAYEIVLRGTVLGVAEINFKKAIRFEHINTQTALIDTGHEAYYLQHLLKKFYGELQPDQPLYFMVMRWKIRDQVAFKELINQWYRRYEEKVQEEHPAQQSLFGQ